MSRMMKAALAVLMPMMLASCVLTPGKFVSTLRIDADRHFAFTYVGEVYAVDMGDDMMKGLGDTPAGRTDPASSDDGSPAIRPAAAQTGNGGAKGDDAKGDGKDSAAKKAATDAKNREIAAALSKEAGYRKVTYAGNGKFDIDYSVSGTLDHAFVYPYNLDAEAVFPFIVVELRANGTVRVKAPGFANDNEAKGAGVPGADQGASKLDGIFTLDTDAEIVSQNNEDGAKTVAGRKTIAWKATPLTKDAPTAVLRLR
jgi:hypothetical protein